jgi:hypothetical protein
MSIPASWQQRLREEQPDPSKWNKELQVLFDDSIEARPLNLPSSSKVKLKDSSYVIYRVRRKNGPNPDSTRFMELRAAGYEPVTLDDLENPEDLTAHVNADETEITEGVDLVWMKAKKEIHYGAMKAHQLKSLAMTSPQRGTAQESIMRSVPLSPGDQQALGATRTRAVSEEDAGNSTRSGVPNFKAIAQKGK